MTDKEQRVWQYLLANRSAPPKEVAAVCGVDEPFVKHLLDRIGTPEEIWRSTDNGAGEFSNIPLSALGHQVGGDHYAVMQVQPWEAMEAWLTPEEYRGYHKGVAIGYLARERQKGGDEDIQKAIHHLQRLTETWGQEGDD